MSDLELLSYIDGRWVAPRTGKTRLALINPATEEPAATVLICESDDADLAIGAARRSFPSYSSTPVTGRIALMQKLIAVYERRYEEMVMAITTEMGAPLDFSRESQAASGIGHLAATIKAAEEMAWEQKTGATGKLVLEPIGVASLITPWNWPINQITAKVGPALLAGCTVVLKPSEQAPLSAALFAEFVAEAGYPAGVFNLVHGTGMSVGPTLSSHPEIDVVSFTGSTRAGILVAKAAAETVKRVSQELGGKSANIVFADADLEPAVSRGVLHCFNNTGQSCNAPTRMLVERSVYAEAVEIAAKTAAGVAIGDPLARGNHLGPVVNKTQYDKIQTLIKTGIAEGARLVAGGLGRPAGYERGYYVKPTVFADVHNQMTIAREEIFGPVLVMIAFSTLEEAVTIANDSPFGLAGYVQSKDHNKAALVASQIRAGSVHINDAEQGYESPFGGYKQSGNGREYGAFGLHEYLEYKTINGFY